MVEQGLSEDPAPTDLARRKLLATRQVIERRSRDSEQSARLGRRKHVGAGERLGVGEAALDDAHQTIKNTAGSSVSPCKEGTFAAAGHCGSQRVNGGQRRPAMATDGAE